MHPYDMMNDKRSIAKELELDSPVHQLTSAQK